MSWWWFRKRQQRQPSEETQQARADTQQARERLEAVMKDDKKIEGLTTRTQRQVVKNNFGADIKRALGGTR